MDVDLIAPYGAAVSPLRSPFMLCLIAVTIGCLLDAIVKDAAEEAAVLVLTTGRYLVGAAMLAAGFAIGRRRWPSRSAWRFHAWRGVAVTVAALAFFHAVATLPLVVATVVGFTAVLMVPPLGWLVLGERPSAVGILAPFVGLLGAALAAAGVGSAEVEAAGTASLIGGVLSALLAAFAYAMALVLLRMRAKEDGAATTLLLANIVPAAILTPICAAALLTPGGTVLPPAETLPVVVVMASMGIAVWWLMTLAYAAAPAFRLAPLEYVALPLSAALGVVVFGESPGWPLWAGAAVIVGACLAVILEERVRSRRPVSTVAT